MNFSAWAPLHLGKGSFYDGGNSYSCHDPRRPDRKASFSVTVFPSERKGKWCDFASIGGDLKFLCKDMGWDAPDEIDGWEENPRSQGTTKKEGSPTPKAKPAAPSTTDAAAEREAAERQKLEAVRRYWDNAGPPDGHPYLERKGIPPQDVPYLRRTTDDYGKDILIVPGYDISGELRSIERIPATEGEIKKHLGPKTNSFCGIRHEGRVTSREKWEDKRDPTDPGRQFYVGLCEGFATSWAVERMRDLYGPVYECFGQMLFPKAIEELRRVYGEKAQMVVYPDAGADERKLEECKALGAVIVRIPEGESKGTDWHDILVKHGKDSGARMLRIATEEAMSEVEEAEEQEKPSSHTVSVEELFNMPEQKLLIKGFLPHGELSAIFGAFQSGKSFLAIDIAMHLSMGFSQWHEWPIRKSGSVLYLNGEGFGGFRRRLRAFGRHHDIDPRKAKLRVSKMPFPLTEDAGARWGMEEIDTFRKEHGEAPVLIVIDTLSRNFGGADENSTRDMNFFVKTLDELKSYSDNAAVLVVHHTGVSSEAQGRGRGSSVLPGALEVQWLCKKSGNSITLENTKKKDLKGPNAYQFELTDYDLGVDDDGDPVGSAAVRFIGTGTQDRASKKKEESLPPSEAEALKAIKDAVVEFAIFEGDDFKGIEAGGAAAIFASRYPGEGDERSKRKTFYATIRRLTPEGKGLLSYEDGIITFTDDGTMLALKDAAQS